MIARDCREIARVSAISSGRRLFGYGAGVGSSDQKRSANPPNRGEWLVNVADDAVVPMTTLEVVDALRKGRLNEQSLVWRIGMHDWTALVEVPQLRLAAGSVPPPAFEEPAAAVRPVPSSAVVPSSLAPITAEAPAASSADTGNTWNRGELDELLSGERRADQRSSRRVVLGAALGSAALAAVFTLLLLRSPSQREVRSP